MHETKKGWSRSECQRTHLHTCTNLRHIPCGDDRCAIYQCVHTRRATRSLNFHCRQTAEGKVASGVKAAVTQQSAECFFFCVKKLSLCVIESN